MSRWVATTLLMVVVAVFSTSFAETAQEVLDKVRKKYDSINDAQLTFSQNTSFEMAKIRQSATGTLFFKKRNKFRVELGEQTVVTDGATVWSYSAINNQVLIDNFKMDNRSLTPEKVLTGAPNEYNATLLGPEKLGDVKTIVLKLVPKNEQSFVNSMKLWVDEDDWLIKQVEIVDVNGKQTEYTVDKIRTNIDLPDSRFTYQVPEGVDVVDLR